MVAVAAQATWMMPVDHMELPDYFLDKLEVTNGQFQKFLEAGGYRDPKYWRYPFRKDGRGIPFQQAVASLCDSTGRQEISSAPQACGVLSHHLRRWVRSAAYSIQAQRAV